jgi:hypothetical protein
MILVDVARNLLSTGGQRMKTEGGPSVVRKMPRPRRQQYCAEEPREAYPNCDLKCETSLEADVSDSKLR